MTREDAINVLYGMKADNLNLDDAYTKDKYDALEIAIKALKQETVSRESYDHEYCLRKELELKVAKLEKQIAEQEPVLDKIRAEICKSKTEHEMQIAEKDIRAKLLISNIYCDIVNILYKYKAGNEVEK